MLDDLRYAFRSVSRTKGLTAILVISLGLGTGANAAAGGALYALLFRAPAGIAGASRLVSLDTSQFSGEAQGPSSYPDYQSLQAQASSFEAIAAIEDRGFENAGPAGLTRSVRVAAVSKELFAVLRMQPHLGRLLGDGDADADRGTDAATDTAPTPPAAVISHTLWTDLRSPDIVGTPIEVGERAYTVVGVAPPRFRGLQAGRATDVWIPLAPPAVAARGDRRLSLIARLAPGVRRAAAASELDRISTDLAREFPATNRGTLPVADAARQLSARPYSPLDPDERSRVSVIAALVGGAVLLLLVSACVNAGSLLLSRIAARRTEVAVRMTMGATRGRLLRQLLLESLLIALAGGALGLLLAAWTTGIIHSRFSPEHAAMLDARVDVRLVLLSVGVAAVAGTLVGLVPALQGTKAPAVLALRADPGGISSRQGGVRLRTLLVGAQLALSTVLLIAAAFLVRGLTHALDGDLGFLARQVAIFSVQNRSSSTPPQRYLETAAEALLKIGGVQSVGWAATLPLGQGSSCPLQIAADTAGTSDLLDFDCNVVSPTYFQTLDASLIEGRLFDAGDHVRAPRVVIVDELLARKHFGATAVGRELLNARGRKLTIVGVVPSGRYRTLQASPQPTVYFPFSQEYPPNGYVLVRTRIDPEPLLAPMADRLSAIDPRMVIVRSSTLEAHLAASLPIDRLTTMLTAACGLIALTMAAIGVYGVTADSVQRRTREIGVRVALGASRPQVVRLVFRDTLAVSAAGVAAGIVAALAIERLVRMLVEDVPALDVRTLAVAPGILAVVVLLAAILPVRRALRVNPTVALRAE